METTKTIRKQRLSNIEALRIFSILLVILHHIAIHTEWSTGNSQMFVFLKYFLVLGGKVGVDLFVLISGWLMINSRPKVSSLARTVSETAVFSVVMYLVAVGMKIKNTHFDVLYFIKRIFPVMFNDYWFVTTFVLMYMTLPILIPFLKQLNQLEYKKTLSVSFLIILIWPLLYLKPGMNFSYPVLFLFLFAVGGYIRNFVDRKSVKTSFMKAGLWALIGVFLTLSTRNLVGVQDGVIRSLMNFTGWSNAWQENIFIWFDASPIPFLVAINIFLAVMNLPKFTNKIVNFFDRHVFGAYLFQSAPIFSPWIYNTFIDLNGVQGTFQRLGAALIVALLLMLIGIVLHVLLGSITTIWSKKLENVFLKFLGGLE